MTADLTREQAREQVARAIHGRYCLTRWADSAAGNAPECAGPDPQHYRDADATLTVLWPVVESLRADLAHAHTVIARHVEPRREGEPRTGGVPIPTEVGVPAPELDGVHERAMEAGQRGVEKMWEEWRARACRPNLGDCCDGSAHTWQPAQGSRLPDRVDGNTPSDALYGDLSHQTPGSGVSGRDDRTEGA